MPNGKKQDLKVLQVHLGRPIYARTTEFHSKLTPKWYLDDKPFIKSDFRKDGKSEIGRKQMSNKVQSASTGELAHQHPHPPPFPFTLDPGATVPLGPGTFAAPPWGVEWVGTVDEVSCPHRCEKIPGGAAVTCDCTLLSKHHWVFQSNEKSYFYTPQTNHIKTNQFLFGKTAKRSVAPGSLVHKTFIGARTIWISDIYQAIMNSWAKFQGNEISHLNQNGQLPFCLGPRMPETCLCFWRCSTTLTTFKEMCC